MTKIGKAAVTTAAALVIGCNCAPAQSASPIPEGATLLHLAVSASVPASPDQLVVDMVAQITSPSAATAQGRVNALIADSMRTAHDVAGVEARAVGYSATPSDEKRTAWTAQQTLELRAANGTPLLDLVGKLQEKGLLTASLEWQLSPSLRRKAHDEATTAALKELQARAASAAATLGLHVDHAMDIRLDSAFNQPRPAFAMTAMASRSAPPPQATAVPEDVTANVSADVLLRP